MTLRRYPMDVPQRAAKAACEVGSIAFKNDLSFSITEEYPWVCFQSIPFGYFFFFSKSEDDQMTINKHEKRREALKMLVEKYNKPNGRGGQAYVANEIGCNPTIIGRMLYPAGKPYGKNIGEDTVDKLNEKFPGWLDPPQWEQLSTAKQLTDDYSGNLRLLPKPIDPITKEITDILASTDDTGRAIALGAIKNALANYMPRKTQTQ